MNNSYRSLPAVHEILADPVVQSLLKEYARERVTAFIRDDLESLRERVRNGATTATEPSIDAVAKRVAARLHAGTQPKLRAVINATGILLHTNLGRAPLAEKAARAAFEAGAGYLNLELDLQTGKRSSRQDSIREWVCQLLGCESATVVNNNAAATVISLRALARGKEVVVSRGQLVEIGGSFRIPEIMAVSGALMKEVGTTNITRLQDYGAAISDQTAALLRVHCSNYRVQGHVESVSLQEMVSLAKERNLLVIDDIGSGAIVDYGRWGLMDEPLASESIAYGADIVLFSGDKLLGGPQAGIVAGRAELIRRIERDPLMRAFRCDKMTLAALEATLRVYLNPSQALRDIPVLAMLETPIDELGARAIRVAGQLRATSGVGSAEPREDETFVGGGSLPGQKMKTWVIAVRSTQYTEAELALRLRTNSPAVMTRTQASEVIIDLRSVRSDQDEAVVAAFAALSE